ncbi:MAG TPA: arylamine N-acetyltransferase [Trebonia sp.]|nr:arylamine N-acetyltransferase [Trebonia sp.]
MTDPGLPAEQSDEWGTALLDLDGYLSRVGLAGEPLPPTGDTLARLHRAHLGTFTFENLDILLGRGVRVDLESVQAKLVGARRGGYCYEHGQLFGAVLARLGFDVDRRLARVWRPGPAGGRTHMTLRVTDPASGARWLADVGFGSSPAGPVPLDVPGPHQVDGWTYDVLPGDRPGSWELHELQGQEWARLYAFDDAIVVPADVVVANHYTSTYPGSWFTQGPVVVRRDPDAIRSLVGRTYTVTRRGYGKERTDLSDAQWDELLSQTFRLAFTGDEVRRLRPA